MGSSLGIKELDNQYDVLVHFIWIINLMLIFFIFKQNSFSKNPSKFLLMLYFLVCATKTNLIKVSFY